MSMWKLVATFAIPPAIALTLLLIIPMPPVVRKGFLTFVQKVLFINVAGSFKLCHFMILITGLALTASSIHTYKLNNTVMLDDGLTANQRIALLAKKWREERNLYQVLSELTQSKDDNKRLRHALTLATAAVKAQGGVPAPVQAEPSAPPAEEADGGAARATRSAAKKKA